MYPLHVSSFQADSYMMLFRSWTWPKKKIKKNSKIMPNNKWCHEEGLIWRLNGSIKFFSKLKSWRNLELEWSHYSISFTDSKVRTNLYSIINSTTGEYCSVAFI